MTGALIGNFLICSKASLSLVPDFLDLPVHVRSHKGPDIVENPGREFGTELGIPWEASYFRLILGFRCVNDRFHSPLGDLQPLSREHFSHVLQALGSNDTANYSHTVVQVVSAGAILQYLPFSG